MDTMGNIAALLARGELAVKTAEIKALHGVERFGEELKALYERMYGATNLSSGEWAEVAHALKAGDTDAHDANEPGTPRAPDVAPSAAADDPHPQESVAPVEPLNAAHE
jgi:hypothetical protein